jgi:uncharacterized phage protein gp47/JayE
MPLKTFSAEELTNIGRAAIRGLVPGADTSDGSDYDVSSRMVAAVAEGAQKQAQHVAEQIFPKTAEPDNVLRHADRYGTAKQPAAKARGLVQLFASAGESVQPVGSALEHSDGSSYTTTTAVAMFLPGFTGKTVIGGSGRTHIIVSPSVANMNPGDCVTIDTEPRAIRAIDARVSMIELFEPLSATPAGGVAIAATRGGVAAIEADDAGAAGNRPPGEPLTLSAPSADVTATCRVIELGGGGDEETIEQLAQRVADLEAGIPIAGNAEHVRHVARTAEGIRVDDAIVFPSFRGVGSVDVFLIGVPGARLVSGDTLDRVQAALDAMLPHHCDALVSALAYRDVETDLDVTIRPGGPEYNRDWAVASLSTGVALASGGDVSRAVAVVTDPSQIEIGDRVLFTLKVGSLWQTYQRTVKGIRVGGGLGLLDLDEPLPIVPDPLSANVHPYMLPGGPLFEPVYAALIELFESLGPSAKQTGMTDVLGYERHPQPAIAWDDTLRLSSIMEATQGIEGVRQTAVTLPSANVQPNPQETVRRGKILIRFEDENDPS